MVLMSGSCTWVPVHLWKPVCSALSSTSSSLYNTEGSHLINIRREPADQDQSTISILYNLIVFIKCNLHTYMQNAIVETEVKIQSLTTIICIGNKGLLEL